MFRSVSSTPNHVPLRCRSDLSGLKLTAYTGPLWPYRILDSLAVLSSMILSSTSSDSLSMRLRSGREKSCGVN